MRHRLDTLGQQQYDNWVPRENAVFAWPSFEAAQRYANNFIQPAIVAFDLDGPAWCVENFILEDLYREYSDDIPDAPLQQLVDRARPWTGDQNSELEVWFAPSVPIDIHEVTDDYGDPLSRDQITHE